ncbi:MAG: aminotransferase class V-fold PLP-dependent enzyme [Microbacteriaceae bacterium]|nr:aminotransferase class V-fold PLP-dependent enzyme [Microbacteriaceae bacterium]
MQEYPTGPGRMHEYSSATEAMLDRITHYTKARMRMSPPPLDGPKTYEYLQENASGTINAEGLGDEEALRVFEDVIAPATISQDHPNFLSFIPAAATEAASAFDIVVSVSNICATSWLESAGVVYAENEVLHWLAAEFGLPEGAGGVFVQGGTLGNLSALSTAREHAKRTKQLPKDGRWKIICGSEGHSSLVNAAMVMDVDIVKIDTDDSGRLTGESVRKELQNSKDGIFAIVATAGTTNFGLVDNLDEIADVAGEFGIWFHVDGAYGLAAAIGRKRRADFKGIERVDSLIIDPHKWMFAPFDACALLYRDPEIARRIHAQKAGYLDIMNEGTVEWNPSDYAINLTRRARGLPLWFSLATYGTEAYRNAIDHGITLADDIAEYIRQKDGVQLVREPQLSVVVFERPDWELEDYEAWADKLMDDGFAFVMPTKFKGRAVTRFAIINPTTKIDDLRAIVDSMLEFPKVKA